MNEPPHRVRQAQVDEAEAAGEDRPSHSQSHTHAVNESRWIDFLEWFDGVVYWLVGLVFLVAALLSLAYGLYAVGDQAIGQMFAPAGFSLHRLVVNGAGAQDIIALVSDLLLTLIIMEVLGTVVHHLREGETTLRPFLFIGIISATRGVLAVGARLSVSTYNTLSQEEFLRDMVELGVNALVIIALGIAMKLIGKFIEDSATPLHRHQRTRVTRSDTNPADPSPASIRASHGVGLELRGLFVLMVVIVLVALTLVAVILASGDLSHL
jgi:hypothetical protein